MKQIKLDVLICTFGSKGLQNVSRMNLPQVDGVRYIVSWQCAPTLREIKNNIFLDRDDVIIKTNDSVGLSRNRNYAISLSSAPYCIVADDDLRYTESQLLCVIETFEKHPDVDVALFRYSGDDNKTYPETETDIGRKWPKNYYITSFEIAFRRESVSGKIIFNPLFGINAPYGCAEECVFLLDCVNAGLNCRFFPVTITHHAGKTTGNRPITDMRTALGEGAFIRLYYGWRRGFMRVPLKAWREWRHRRIGLLKGLVFFTKGFLIPPRTYAANSHNKK